MLRRLERDLGVAAMTDGLTFGEQGMEEWGTIITTITTILPFPTKQR